LIAFAVTLPPVVKLAGAQLQPTQQTFDEQASLVRPGANKIDHLVAYIRLDPAAV